MRLNGYQAPEWTAPIRLRIIGSVTRETYSLFYNQSQQSPVLGIPRSNNGHVNDPLTESDVLGNILNRRIFNTSNCLGNGNNQNVFLHSDSTKHSDVSLPVTIDTTSLQAHTNSSFAIQARAIIRNKTVDANSISSIRENLPNNAFDLFDLLDGPNTQSNVGSSADRFSTRDIALMNSLNQNIIEQVQPKIENPLRTMVTSQNSLWSNPQHRSVLNSFPENDRLSDHSPVKRLSVKTPLLHGAILSNALSHPGSSINIWLKLENIQPTGSFKIRGTEKACQKWSAAGINHIVCPSNGNAGIAAAFAARAYGMNCTLVVPDGNESMVRKRLALEALETKVISGGPTFLEAHHRAEQLVSELRSSQTGSARLLHPYDQSELWEGYETIIDELAQEMNQPDAIVVAVGGGGLLTGIIQGLWNKGWTSTHVVAIETEGADCFNRSWKSGQVTVIPRCTSVASSLNAPVIAHRTWNLAQCHSVSPVTCTDAEAIDAVKHFLDDYGMLVEPACGAALSTVYSGYLNRLQQEGRLPRLANVVIIIGGGRNVSLRQLIDWESQLSSVVPEQIATSVLAQSMLYMPRALTHTSQVGTIGQLPISDHEDIKLPTPRSMTPRMVISNSRLGVINASDGDSLLSHNNERDCDISNNYVGTLNPHDLVNFSKLLAASEVEDDKSLRE